MTPLGRSTSRPITVSGLISKKWRDWEESLLDVLAPFVKDGGRVVVKGEDYDCATEWRFHEGVRHVEEFAPVSCSELAELQAKALRCDEAIELLRLVHKSLDDTGQFQSKVDAFLNPPALVQLAWEAE